MLARPKRFELLTPRFVVWCCYKTSTLKTEPFLLSNKLVVGGFCLPRSVKISPRIASRIAANLLKSEKHCPPNLAVRNPSAAALGGSAADSGADLPIPLWHWRQRRRGDRAPARTGNWRAPAADRGSAEVFRWRARFCARPWPIGRCRAWT